MPKSLMILLSCFILSSCSAEGIVQSDATPVSHRIWDELLQKHVDEQGLVDYKGFMADSTKLNEYLDLLSKHHPNEKNWSPEQRLAYWINAYNAFTIKLILDHYPVESIKDIGRTISIPFVNSPWDIKFIEIEGAEYDLNNIEHGIIRKEFNEPRIHFALVCAAISCPKLRKEAYIAEKLDAQLEEQARQFFNNPEKNKITPERAEISKILNWYGGDFKEEAPSKIDYINRYSKVKLRKNASVNYLDYDWRLNEQ
jgi:hypothetical protein